MDYTIFAERCKIKIERLRSRRMRLADPAADAVHKAGGKDGGGAPPPHGQDQIPEVGLFQRDGRKTVAGNFAGSARLDAHAQPLLHHGLDRKIVVDGVMEVGAHTAC